jgi:hypothetical protein
MFEGYVFQSLVRDFFSAYVGCHKNAYAGGTGGMYSKALIISRGSVARGNLDQEAGEKRLLHFACRGQDPIPLCSNLNPAI